MTPTPEQIEKMAELAPKYDGSKCSSTRRDGWLNGYTAAHNDAQGEIEKLKAENSKLKENIQWLELDIKDMRELYLSNDSKLTLERAASAELKKALEAVVAAKCFDSCAHPQSVWWNIWVQQPAAQAIAAHNARQKERGE